MQISTQILRPEHREAGLYLEENDHTLYLKRDDEILAKWSATGASRDSILNESDRYMQSKE